MMEIELLLRKYGITSTCGGTTYSLWESEGSLYFVNKFRRELAKLDGEAAQFIRKRLPISEMPIVVQGTNVQLTRTQNHTAPKTTLVDFTHYEIIDQCRHLVYVSNQGRQLFLGDMIKKPGDDDYTHPDPNLAIPFKESGEIGCIWGYENAVLYSKLMRLCFQLADDYRAGKIDRETVSLNFGTYFQRLTQHLGPDKSL